VFGEKGYESIAPMVKVLKMAVSARGATSNVLEALDLFETATNKIIDLLPNKNRIEPVMYSLVRNNVLNQKRTGNSVPQVPSTLWDSIDSTRRTDSKGKVYSSKDLEYHVDEGYADIYLPIPMNWVDGLMEAYDTRDLIRLVDMVNNDIANKNYSKFDEDILYIKGLRIPNQQLASNDIFKIKKFLVPTNVAMVIVPSIITTKVGSDFDIDKLNMYMSNVIYSDGKLVRINKQFIEDVKVDKREYVNYKEFNTLIDVVRSLGVKVPIFEDKSLKVKVQKLIDFVKDLEVDSDRKKFLIPTIIEQLQGMLDIANINIRTLEQLTIDNELLDIERKIMLNPLNYTNLMKPTDDRQWKGMGKDEGKGILKSRGLLAPEMNYWNVVTATTNIEKTVENISSKGGVGQVAVHITGHANGQLYNLQVNLNDYSIPFVTDGSLGKIINENGEFISDLLSGLLTSQVDAVKDPYAKSLGLVNQTLNIAAYMLKRGVSHVKIIEFFAEPIIRDYIKTQQIWESPLYSESGLAFQMKNNLRLEKTNQVADALVRKKREYSKKDLEKLDLFQTLVEHGKVHSKMIKAMSPDTFKPKSLSDTKGMQSAIDFMVSPPEGTAPFIDNFASRNDKAVSPVLMAHDEVTSEYKKLYAQFYMENQEFIKGKLEMMAGGIAEVSYGENLEKNMKRLYEDFVNYLVQNYTENFKKYPYSSLMTGDNSIPKQIIGLRNKSDEYRLFEMLVPQTRNSEFGTERLDNARMVDINDNPFNLESYINEIKELAENDPEFVDKLIAFTIYQSGMSNSVYTIDKILPAEYKHKLMQEAVNNVKNGYLDMNDFMNKFQMANPHILKKSSKGNKEKAGLFQFLKTGQKMGRDYRTIIEKVDGTKYYPLGSSSFRIYNTEPILFKGNTVVQKGSDDNWTVFDNSSTLIQRSIYDNLGNKTQSENVILPKDLGLIYKSNPNNFWTEIEPEFRKKYPKGLVAFRGKNSDFNIGNPFDWQDFGVGQATKMFIDWIVTGNNYDVPKATDELRKDYIEKIKRSRKEKILYYAETGSPTHSTALDYLINKYNWTVFNPTSETSVDVSIETKDTKISSSNIVFKEFPVSGYKERTVFNASADATIALAYDFSTAGERLTKNSVLGQNKKYIPINIPKKNENSDINNAIITTQVNIIVEELNSINAKTINIAGNGIYTMKDAGWNQEDVDLMTYRVLEKVINSPKLNSKIQSIRTGGQTGFDEAGAKAGLKLGVPTTINAPKGWIFRDINGKDISSEKLFKERFGVKMNDLFDNPNINTADTTKPCK